MTFVEIAELFAPNGLYDDPEMERDVYEAPRVLSAIEPDPQDIFEVLRAMQGGQTFPQAAQPSAPPTPETPFSQFIRSKIPIVLIALIVYTVFAANLDFIVGGAVFSSLIAWEVFEFFMTTFVIKPPTQQGGLINLLFMFGGVSQGKSQLILRILGLTNKVLRDSAIFMFVFVLIHLIWSYLVIGESLTEILDKDFNNLLKNEL